MATNKLSSKVATTKARPKTGISKVGSNLGNIYKISQAAPTGGKLGVTKSGTVVPNTKISKNPYTAMAQTYQNNLYRDYNANVQQLGRNRDYQKSQVNAQYNTAAQNAYSAYMNSLRTQAEVASNYGMTGGAVEKMRVANATQYAKNTATNEAGRAKGLTDADIEYSNAQATALSNYNQAVNAKSSEMRLAAQTAKEEQQRQDLSTYASTVGRYDTLKKINKAIKSMKKSKDPEAKNKLMMLRAQKAYIKAQKKKEK